VDQGQQRETTAFSVRSADGTAIGGLRQGEGTALVLVHGALMDHNAWNGVAPFLRPRFSLYLLDRRGRGASEAGPAYAVEREIEDLAAVIDAVDGEADVLAHSSGAVLALQAAERGLPIRRLALYEPPIVDEGHRTPLAPDLADRLDALVAAGRPEEAVRVFLREGPLRPKAEIDRLLASPSRAAVLTALAPTAAHDARIVGEYDPAHARLAAVRTPVLLLRGELSPAWTAAGLEVLKAALPECRVAVLEGQEHLALQTAPELIAREVLAFLGSDS